MHTRFAIIGGGFGALMLVSVLRFRGVPRRDIAVYTPQSDPAQEWEKTIRSFHLTHMRSESLGHFFPTDSPGLATVQAVHDWSIKPLLLSWFDQYHPTVDFFLQHTRAIARQVGYYHCVVPGMVTGIVKTDTHFEIHQEADSIHSAQHVVLAVGHGRLRLPPFFITYRARHGMDGLVTHAFETKEYAPPRRVLIIGDGLTAGTECINVLQVGGTVQVVSTTDHFIPQALNTPRKYFSRRGLVPYRQQETATRVRELRRATRGTIKPYVAWRRILKRAQREKRLQYVQGVVEALDRKTDGQVVVTLRLPDNQSWKTIEVDQVIVATGFEPASTNPLLAQLIDTYTLPLMKGYLHVDNDFCIPDISTPAARVFVIGPAAAWALPSADSLGGMKIVAHRVATLALGSRSWHFGNTLQVFFRWVRLVTGKELTHD